MTGARQHPQLVLTADQAARICAERGANFTPLRRRVFETLLNFEKPASAYDLMRALREELGRPVAPPTAYRALAFLQEQGLVLRVGSLAAFVPAFGPKASAAQALCLCQQCGAVAPLELAEIEPQLSSRAAEHGFQLGKSVIELQGTCADCHMSSRRPS